MPTADANTFRGFELYPFQRDAIRSILADRSVIVAAPTGAGKTLVADFAIEHALAEGERIVYTSPVKALSNQKFRDFREQHGDDVGIMTGDVTINRNAPLLIMTTEVFRNTIFEDPGGLDDTRWLVFDEVHYLDDWDRGTVWEESIIFAPEHMRFVCLSATVPNVRELAAWIEEVREQPIDVVVSDHRPVPLRHFFHAPRIGLIPIQEGPRRLRRPRGRHFQDRGGRELLDLLQGEDLLPCLFFSFSRKDCEKLARANARRNLLTKGERRRILELFDDLKARYQLRDGKSTERLRDMASRGSMYHHMLKKFDGVAMDWLRTRDYYQMAGRAGRQGIDTEGHVVSRLNLKWDDPAEASRLVSRRVEPVMSRFNLSYSGLLSLYDRLGEDLRVAYEKSFARFQRMRLGKKKRRRPPREAVAIDKRLDVLRQAGYIDEEGLTEKGLFAEYLNGYEVQAAELHSEGLYHLADETQLAILMVAVVYEERKGDSSARLPAETLGEIRRLAERRVRRFVGIERSVGLVELTKEPVFSVAAPTRVWARGGSLEEVRAVTNISEGDLVRYFRMGIQLMRQVRGRLRGEKDLEGKFAEAIDLLDRDEVDARRQLELG
ncbi:MAG: DEAD/DEAH box helicase [Planctomycetota bacterium]|jgi:superfamily II RNA helicase